MRLFYAVEIPEDIKAKLEKEIQTLEEAHLKLSKASQYHITLLFIGEVEPRNVKFLEEALDKFTFKKFKLSLEGLKVFLNRDGTIKVVYKDIRKGASELRKIHNYLAVRCGESLSNKNSRTYEPHLTLARGKIKDIEESKDIEAKIEIIHKYSKNLEFTVKDILLVNSTLSSRGSKYKVIKKLLLSQ